MKTTFPLVRTTLLASVLALAGAGAVLAQDASPTTTTTPPPAGGGGGGWGGGGGHHFMDKILTPDERALLKKDTDAVLASDPDLKKEGDDLMSQRPAQDASADDKQAFHAKMKDHRDKVKDAVEKLDASTVPIYAKIDAAMQARKSAAASNGGGQ
jgi:hypothetical protein